MSNLTVQRQPVDIQTLHQMVDLLVSQLVLTKAKFTPYGVTLALRHLNPDLEIPHYMGVQERVWELMGGPAEYAIPMACKVPDYVYSLQTWTTADATTYEPSPTMTITATPVQSTVVAPRAVPQLPAKVQIRWD